MPAAADSAQAPNRATPDRIVDEALRLFARNGFQGTTVGEIERRAGLTPRAGALYKHFPSKEAVLEAAFERHVAELEAISSIIDLMPLGDLRAELTLLARSTLQLLERERSLRRIVVTEGDRFPELKHRFKEGVVDRGYREATGFVRQKMDTGEFPDGDAEATAVVMVGALLAYEFEIDVFGRPPAGVDGERLIEALVDSWMAMSTREKESA
ncbi:MAG: TetR/AcrR family transcriptional regulator [Solirubrobacterales bacterium]